MKHEKIEKIDKLILEAMKAHETQRVATLRLIKAKYLEFLTKEDQEPFTDKAEEELLMTMVDERRKSIRMYEQAKRFELAEQEKAEIKIIGEFLPGFATEDDVKAKFDTLVELGMVPEKKNMGVFIKSIKEAFPGVDGAMVAKIVQENLK